MRRLAVLVIALVAGVLVRPELAAGEGFSAEQRCCSSAETLPYKATLFEDHGLKDVVKPAGHTARGFSLTVHWLDRVGAAKTAALMKSAHMNAVVFAAKDEWGQVLWPSEVPLSKRVQRRKFPDLAKIFKTFHDAGIYVIVRIVCFKDSKLPLVRPDLSVRSGYKGRRLFSADAGWLDPYSQEVQDYLIALALELEQLGADEIQLDYVRFPKGKASKYGVWLHKDDRDRATVIADFLEKTDRALSIPLSVDLYGLTTLVDGDPRGLGQTIERLAPFVEAISPMMYANSMSTYFPNETVNENVYAIIQCGLWRARQKAPNILLRPYLQAFPSGVSFYGPEFLTRQIVAAERAGSDGFLFFNPTMKNTTAYAALRALGPRRLANLGIRNGKRIEPRSPGDWCKREGRVF